MQKRKLICLVGIGGMEGCTRYFKKLPMEVEPRRSTCSCWPAQSCVGPTITGLAVSSWIPGSCLHQSMYVPSIDTPRHAVSQLEWVCDFFEICQEPIAFVKLHLTVGLLPEKICIAGFPPILPIQNSWPKSS